ARSDRGRLRRRRDPAGHGRPARRRRRAMTGPMPLSQLLPDVALPRDIVVSGLEMDSRRVRPGDAFVALPGVDEEAGQHGLAHARQAQAAGAAAILFEPPAPPAHPAPDGAIAVPGLQARLGPMADAFHGHPSGAMTVVGATGTNG